MTRRGKRMGVVYDDPSTRSAVVAVMERCGFEVALLRGPGSELVAQAGGHSPELVVIDLASGGSRGLGIVADLRRAVPNCSVVLLAPFESLRESAIAAGAYELAGRDDPRELERCLRRLFTELEARDSAAGAVRRDLFAEPAPQWEGE